MSPEVLTGVIGCVLLLVLLASSMPVGFAMAIVGTIGMAVINGNLQSALYMGVNEFYDTFSNPSFIVIPLFVLMGQISFHAGISKRLFNSAYRWLGHLHGGMAMATVGACTIFGAICGSGPATAATMASVAIPEMKRYKYSMELASGAVAAGGSIGMLIPPSVVFIVYGIMTQESIGKLFIAGIIPGVMIAILFCLSIFINCKRNPELGPACEKSSWKQRLISLKDITETLILFFIVLGGMFMGFFSPTSAAGIGAAGSIVIALSRKQLSFKSFKKAVAETIRTSCMVLTIVAGAGVLSRFLATSEVTTSMADWLVQLTLPSWCIMTGIILFFLIAGCFIDALALILLTIPIFENVIPGLGYDMIWFGVMVVLVTQMGVITPPVGVNAYVVSGIERDISLQTVFKGSMPFLLMLIIAAAILMLFPQIATWLPGIVK
ncbi:MAG: TRAP transporter large permease [Kiritimatiellae bacterium]|jgi:C4-dicarboxylate transporter DctM subunit|nr:TRAP transporter large permease [Kiritimatiellia bacterium]